MDANERLRKIFRDRAINVFQFAKMVDVTPTTLYAVVNGKTKVERTSVDVFIKVAHGLGMTGDELYCCIFEVDDAR